MVEGLSSFGSEEPVHIVALDLLEDDRGVLQVEHGVGFSGDLVQELRLGGAGSLGHEGKGGDEGGSDAAGAGASGEDALNHG